MSSTKAPEGELLVGGQALIEGVMMRSPGAFGVAVRRPDGSIAFQRGKVDSLAKRYPFLKLPLVRGVAVLFQSLAIGIRALNFSAEEAMAGIDAKTEASAPEPAQEGKEEKKTSSLAIAGSMAFGLGAGVVFFILLPLWLTHLAERYVFGGQLSNMGFNLVDGGLRAVFFLGYIFAISRMKDIHRVFQYHGAEHKVVFNYEKKLPLTVENARAQSRLHPRCGTSFLLFVMAISILVFSLVPSTAHFLVKFGARVVLIPLIAGLAYEVIRFSARHLANPVCRAMTRPGMWLQKITTKEPDDQQLEIAIVALKEALLFDVVDEKQAAVA